MPGKSVQLNPRNPSWAQDNVNVSMRGIALFVES